MRSNSLLPYIVGALVFFVAVALRVPRSAPATPPSQPFEQRGYYITLMRMPVMGLAEWKQAVDCFAEDDINTLILWTAGGFRSNKFPVTWKYNADHANIQHDFVRDLIDYAHTKHIRVLLGFTPFGYDGTNQYPLEHPELKARKADGSPVDPFGIHSIGWNLCPAQPESQRFMREYIREMYFDFYPNADGLLIESSDYAICHCPDCGPHFYDHEFDFVRDISNEVWQKNPNATILVFPHYFTGAKVPGLDATAAKKTFDPCWGLSFAPHSAPFDADLMQKAKTTISWSDATALHTPHEVAAAAHTARENGATGFIPSLEAFSYVATVPEAGEPSVIGKRHHPYGFDPLGEGKTPYDTLPVRVQRFAYRCFSQDPDLNDADFQHQVAQHFFGSKNEAQAATDLLELQRIWSFDSDWYWPSPLLDPEFFAEHAKRTNWSAAKLADFDHNLVALRAIASRYSQSTDPTKQEMSRLATSVTQRWDTKQSTPSLIASQTEPAPVTAHATLAKAALQSNEETTLSVQITIAPGWHIYSSKGTAAAQPTSLSLDLPNEVTTTRDWKTPVPDTLVTSLGLANIYRKDATFTRKIKIPAGASPGKYTLGVIISYEACNETRCLQPTSMRLSVPFEIVSK